MIGKQRLLSELLTEVERGAQSPPNPELQTLKVEGFNEPKALNPGPGTQNPEPRTPKTLKP